MATQTRPRDTPSGLTFGSHAQVFDEDAGIMVDCDMLIIYHANRGGNVEWHISADNPLSEINGVPC